MPEIPKCPFLATLLVGALLTLGGCDLSPRKVLLSDPEIQPLLKALELVDRDSLGFTPVTTNAQISLELHSLGGAYDAMLHVYGVSSRTIAFRKTSSGFRWIFEQESYEGPNWRQTVDGTFRESMLIEYQTERIDGVPTNQLYISYSGSDTNLTDRELTLAEVRPILEKWSATPAEPKPPDLPGTDMGVGSPWFLPLLFLMLVAVLVVCCLALLIGLILLAISAALLAVGMVSTALLVGVLRKSVSAGFRTLFIQIGAVAGMVGGAIVTSASIWIAKADWQSPSRWVTGVTIGLLVGIFLAWLFNKVWIRVAQELTSKLDRKGN